MSLSYSFRPLSRLFTKTVKVPKSRVHVLLSVSFQWIITKMSSEVGKVHLVAQEGFTQGSHYDQSRPSYADELVSHVAQKLHLADHEGTKYDVLELGAGTGKFTRKFLEMYPQQERLSYLATDPSADFLAVLQEQSPGLETHVCSASSIPLNDCSVKNVICAQCFHWFASIESLKEIWRVLVPRGRLILVWNDKDWNIEWLRKMESVLTLYYGDTPRKITGKWKNVFEDCDLFRCVEHKYLPGVKGMKGSKNFVLDHFTSISVIARLRPEEKREAVEKFRAVVDEAFTDNMEIDIPFKSDFYCAEKL